MTTNQADGKQAELAELVARAEAEPGVADLAKLYEGIRSHLPVMGEVRPSIRYATGGNV